MNNLKISVIIPVYNRREEVAECLRTVFSSDYDNYEVVVVDDCSRDGTVAYLSRNFPAVKLLANKENHGAAFSRNAGARVASGQILFFLDSDTAIAPDTLSKTAEIFARYPDAGLVAPIIYYFCDPKRIWYAGAFIDQWTSRAHYRGINEIDRGQYREGEIPNGHAPTASAIKREVLFRAGLFEEREDFYMGFEEPDLAKRIERQGGRLIFAPAVKVWHKIPVPEFKDSRAREFLFYISFRTPKVAYTTSRNRVTYMRRYAPKFNYFVFRLVFLPLSLAIYWLKSVCSHQPDMWKNIWRGTRAALKQKNV